MINELYPDRDPSLPPDNPADSQDDQDDVNTHDGHRVRLRRQIMNHRLEGLTPMEVLEFMLGCILPRQDIAPVARAVMEYFGDIREVLNGELEQFLQIKGLGEAGALWMDMICRSQRLFSDLPHVPRSVLPNYRQLRRCGRILMDYFQPPCCILLLTDAADHILMHRPLINGLNWGEPDVIINAADTAAAMHAPNAYLIIFTDDVRRHPSRYDLRSLRCYLKLMLNTFCAPRDVLFMDRRCSISMRNLGLMPGGSVRTMKVAEDESVNPPGGELILHRCAGGDSCETRIPICKLEEENERTEPV